jgi:hypothetical protein
MIKSASNPGHISGTSFFGQYIHCSFNDLVALLGMPQYMDNIGKKTNFEWDCELEDGTVFCIYDWKEYRVIADDEDIKWHIAAHSYMKSIDAYCELSRALGFME